MTGRVVIDAERCKGCGLCVSACAKDVLVMGSKANAIGYLTVEVSRPDECTGCCSCAVMCPDVAITVFRDDRSTVKEEK